MNHKNKKTPVVFQSLRFSLRGFTLVELMVVLVIISILTGLVVEAIRGAQEDTFAAKTRGTIEKIDAVLSEKMDEYLTVSLKFQSPQTFAPQLRSTFPIENRVTATSPLKVSRIPSVPANSPGLLRERVRLAATRDLMRMEMPDCVADLFTTAYARPVSASVLFPFDPYVSSSPASPYRYSTILATGYWIAGTTPLLMRLETPVGFQRIIERVWRADQSLSNAGAIRSSGGPVRWSDTYANEELLYLIVDSASLGGSPAMETFNASEIADRDGDGLQEFIDAWGNPIRWLRWPSGINGVAPFNPDPLDPIQIGADPFDSTLCDIGYDLVNAGGGAYPYRPGDALRPLVISAGLDGRFGIRFYAADQTALPTSGFMSATSSASSVMVTGSASFKSPPYWTFGSFNWPDPYWPRESMGSRVGAVLSSSADPAGDPIGVELNPSPLPPAFILNPSSDTNYVIHAGNNVSNLDESGAAP